MWNMTLIEVKDKYMFQLFWLKFSYFDELSKNKR